MLGILAQSLAVLAPIAAQGTAVPATARPTPVELRVDRAVGQRVVHAFVLDRSLVVQRLVTRTSGVEQNSQDELEFGGRTSLKWSDEIRALEGPRATVFRRVLDEALIHMDMRRKAAGQASDPRSFEGGSPLVGAGVLFRWIPARNEYGRLYDGVETSEEFLPRLEPELGLGGLLPPRAVAVGDRWEIEPARARDVFAFGGPCPIRFGKGADAHSVRTTSLGVAGPLDAVCGAGTTGRISAELVAVESGVARIALTFDIRCETDLTALSAERMTPVERYDQLVPERAGSAWTFRGEGELRWNVTHGHAERLGLSGAETLKLAVAIAGPQGANGFDLDVAGGLKLSIDTAVTAGPTGSK